MDENQKKLKNKNEAAVKLPELYLHRPDADRFQDFINNSKEVLKLLYNKDYAPDITKRNFTEKLTKYPEEGNMAYIKSLIGLDNGEKNLIIAPTGSGKTYSIDAIFQQINAESDGKQLLCLLCPNRVQNIQNEKSDDYNFEALVAGVQLEENEHNVRQISAVYDKVSEIIRYKEIHPDCKLRIVIDECQTLVSANVFRAQAIDSIMMLIDKNFAASYTFITATYENMCCFPFDNILLFEDKNYKPVFKAVDIKYAQQKHFENLVVDTAIKESKPYIRLNDREMIKKVMNTLNTMGQKCFSVTSDDKGSTVNKDGTITYNNVIFDHIVNNDDLYNNDGEADTILATSLLDAGTNFTKYSPESTPVFAVFNPKLMNLDEIEQAFNRFRPQKNLLGNIIQLEHALIIHQLPNSALTKAGILKPDNSGKMEPVKNIPPKAVVYTENTFPEEKQEGLHRGIFTINGKYFSDLEDGKYILRFVFGDTRTPVLSNLYVNCWSDERPDDDTLHGLFSQMAEAYHTWQDDEQTSSYRVLEQALLTLTDAISSNRAFVYNTGDEKVSAQIALRPYAFFESLTSILGKYLKEANKYRKEYDEYKERNAEYDENEEDDIFNEADQRDYLENFLNMLKRDVPHIGNALYFTKSMKLSIDRRKLFNSAYSAYQNQFYYYPERLMDELKLRLNVPVSISYYTPKEHKLEIVDDDREIILKNLNVLYKNPATKDILCNVLHLGKKIPMDLKDKDRKAIAGILQSRLYKKEYTPLLKHPVNLTFDYIVKVLNILNGEKDVNKHIKRLDYLIINQAIERNGAIPFSSKAMKMQFTEQKMLISIISEKRKTENKKKYTVNEKFMKPIREEFNQKMSIIVPSYTPKSPTQFKNLLYFVYIIINRDIASREPELTEPILSIDKVPFK